MGVKNLRIKLVRKDLIVKLRKEDNYTLQELAQIFGMTKGRISQILKTNWDKYNQKHD